MTAAALAVLQLAIQAAPEIIQFVNTAQMANDLTEDQLQQLLDSEHQAIAGFGAAVQAAKTTTQG